jgi:hypothetical protein
MPDNAPLEGFSARPYLRSVKGYLDPAGAYTLAAASLALGDQVQDAAGPPVVRDDAGICLVTQYGAPSSAFRFFQQLVQKGPRLASPLLFPHGYSNTAANLAAIELGFGGPHMVLYGTADVAEGFRHAVRRLQDGSATDMLVAACEAVVPDAVPDDTSVLNGAVVAWLSSRSEAPVVAGVDPVAGSAADVGNTGSGAGAVQAMLLHLQGLA